MPEQTDHPIRPRKPRLDFSGVPRHWFGGSPVATHLANGFNMLFPAGERFFVRSVNHYMEQIRDPALQAQIRGFFGQEGRHANAHEQFFATMREQGYEIDRFLAIYERLAFGVVERYSPPALNLAGTAAAEHFTAIMAEGALADDVLETAHPAMRYLLRWHAAEEIEHKAVAFDVLKQVNPSYALRMAGLAMATLNLGAYWVAAAAMLLRQDRLSLREIFRDQRQIKKARGQRTIGAIFRRGIREYIRRDFHPSQNDNYALAWNFLRDAGLEQASEAAA